MAIGMEEILNLLRMHTSKQNKAQHMIWMYAISMNAVQANTWKTCEGKCEYLFLSINIDDVFMEACT